MASNALHHQVMSSHSTLEDIMACPKQQQQQQHQEQHQQQNQQQQQEKRVRPHPEQALRCPRCDSTNTKFCYYNNYSLSQPRYFCKGCRRYWTQGGTLRNVPVGGGCRKNKRSSSSSSSSTTTSFKRFQDHTFTTTPPTTNTDASNTNTLLSNLPNPSLPFEPTDLALAFTRLQRQQPIPTDQQHDPFLLGSSTTTTTSMLPTSQGPSFLDILRSGFLENGYPSVGYEFGGGAAAGGGVAAKEESGEGDSDRVGGLLLQQWQDGGEGNMFLDVTGRGECWVGGIGAATAATTPWHGLVNSSLM